MRRQTYLADHVLARSRVPRSHVFCVINLVISRRSVSCRTRSAAAVAATRRAGQKVGENLLVNVPGGKRADRDDDGGCRDRVWAESLCYGVIWLRRRMLVVSLHACAPS